MNGNLRGYGESVLIILITTLIYILIGLVIWAVGVSLLKYVFGVEGMAPALILALLVAAAILAYNYYSLQGMKARLISQEETTRSFFEVFERTEYDRLVQSLKRMPAFSMYSYLFVSVVFLVAAVLVTYYINHGYLLAPVFVVFVWYMWHSRNRSMKLTAAFYNGNSLIAKGRASDALHIGRTMLRIKPNSVGGHWLVGNALFALRDYDGASRSYELAIQYNPASAKYLLAFLGLCFQRLGLYQRALRTYEEALRRNPDAKEVHYGIACTYALAGDPAHALPHLEHAAEHGYVDRDYMERDGDLDNVRDEPKFREILSRIS